MDLGNIRRGIDQVNRDLVGLLNKRFDLVDRVGLYKFIEGLEIENKSREHDIKASLLRDFDLKDEVIVGLFEYIIDVSKARQARNFDNYKRLREACMDKSENILLVGMPGSGKTTIGKKLSSFMNKDFIDVDEIIYKENKSRPGEIIEKHGEDYFRNLETLVLERVLMKQGKIIATGGGLVVRDENLDLIKKSPNLVFYIDRKLEDLAIEGRPLSQGGLKQLEDLYGFRNKRYESISTYKLYNDDIYDTVYSIVKIYTSL